MARTFFITTAIDYTNAPPHIGHAYEKILADVLARYHRLKGESVFFLTGVDQHGQKVQQSAEKAGVEPQEFVEGVTKKFVALWEKLGISHDKWAATTNEAHKKNVGVNLQKLWDDKDPATGESRWIYKKTQRGFYSIRQEQFLTDKERGPDGEFGPEWGLVEERDEENFYFRLTRELSTGLPGYNPKQWLLDFIDRRSAEDKPFVIPDFRVAELRNAVEKLDGDLCISRPASRLKWGIPFPESFGAGFVTYVWFDALVNYISFAPGHDPNHGELGAGQETEFAKWWATALHVIGKDILIPAHGVYWPIMLKAFEFSDDEMPRLLVHGWWNISGAKMSKSTGNVVDPEALVEKYGAEAVRYYLMSDIATGRDSDFSEERLVMRYNTDLANDLGNLLNRSLNMAKRYRAGVIRDSRFEDAGAILLREQVTLTTQTYAARMDEFQIHAALEAAWNLVSRCNGFIETSAPWKLAKDPANDAQLDTVLYHLAESLRIVAILISPVMPRASETIFAQLQIDSGRDWRDISWGVLPDGHQLGEPVPLFPRLT